MPELDGLRAAGMTVVLLNHFWPKSHSLFLWQLGRTAWIAMDSFFVLSGFLIAGILLDARRSPDYFRTFFVRRALRILPLYYVVLIGLLGASALWRGGAPYRDLVENWGSPAPFFVYLGNFSAAFAGAWPRIAALGPLWSLQIEEQFYLLLPFAILYLRPRTLSRLLWAAVFLSPSLRLGWFLWNPHNPFPPFVLLPCHMEGLALGALIALRFRQGPWKIATGRLATLTLCLLAAAGVGSYLSDPAGLIQPWFTAWNRTIGYSISSIGCAGLVLWLVRLRGSSWTGWLRLPPIQYLGTISYGIYLLHYPILMAVNVAWKTLSGNVPEESPLRSILVVTLSIASASASWHLMERPLLRLKDRLAPVLHAEPEYGRVGAVRGLQESV